MEKMTVVAGPKAANGAGRIRDAILGCAQRGHDQDMPTNLLDVPKQPDWSCVMAFRDQFCGRGLVVLALSLAAWAAPLHAANADESRKPAVSNAKWKSECGSCHVAYPPNLLPAESWRAIMSQLDRHFGSNAGMDPETAREITAFLEANAGVAKQKPAGKVPLRITETAWFKSEHRKVPAHIWKSSKVRSPANCGACHATADAGDFSERNVKVPR
jgi:nitrate/TMAO reductase-like tetraheme cytochrome c subunit